jgi:hypothetical protein
MEERKPGFLSIVTIQTTAAGTTTYHQIQETKQPSVQLHNNLENAAGVPGKRKQTNSLPPFNPFDFALLMGHYANISPHLNQNVAVDVPAACIECDASLVALLTMH